MVCVGIDVAKDKHDCFESKPKGLHAVVSATEETPVGVIFVLKNINNSVNIDNQNRIHPFYMVYISSDGDIVCDYLKACLSRQQSFRLGPNSLQMRNTSFSLTVKS